MRLVFSSAGLRTDFCRGLLLLATIGVALTLIFLCLDWVAFEDRSSRLLILLACSIFAAFIGAWAVASLRSAIQCFVASVLIAAGFRASASISAWLKNPHFFLARSKTLMEFSLLAFVLSILVLTVDRRSGHTSRSNQRLERP